MIPKLVLVMYMLTGRGDPTIQYIVKYPTEAACQAEAVKYKPLGFQAYPVQRAYCTFDASSK